MNPEATHFIEHHDDIAGGHEGLLFDLVLGEHFNPGGGILNTCIGSGCVYSDCFFQRFFGLKLHQKLPLAYLVNLERRFGWQESIFCHRYNHDAEGGGTDGDAYRVGLHFDPVDANSCAHDRGAIDFDLDPNRDTLLREGRNCHGKKDKNQ